MNLADLANHVCQTVGKLDADSLAQCKAYLQARHEMAVDSYPWKDTLDVFDVEVEAESETVILPTQVARPMAAWDKDAGLDIPVTSLASIIQTNPAALTEVGGLIGFEEASSVGFPFQIAADGSKFLLVNQGTEAVTVSITGTRALSYPGIEMEPVAQSKAHTVAANGGLTYTDTWKSVARMTKARGCLVLVVQFEEPSPAPSWAWPAESTDAQFARLRLIRRPAAAFTMSVFGKKKLAQMWNDADGPMVRGIDNALIAFATGDMLERGRQYAKAAAKIQEGTALLDGVRDLERSQSARESRIIPVVYAEEGDSVHQW